MKKIDVMGTLMFGIGALVFLCALVGMTLLIAETHPPTGAVVALTGIGIGFLSLIVLYVYTAIRYAIGKGP